MSPAAASTGAADPADSCRRGAGNALTILGPVEAGVAVVDLVGAAALVEVVATVDEGGAVRTVVELATAVVVVDVEACDGRDFVVGLGVEVAGVTGFEFSARTEAGVKFGTPEALVPPASVPPKTHASTSPGSGTLLIALSWLKLQVFWPAGASQ